jgi:ABC-type transport system involved in multi-copper enzyme maturation permease subunit
MLAAVSTGINLLKNAARKRGRRGGIAAGLVSAAAGLLEVLWTEAAFLILPAMVIEDMSLSNAAKRVAQIVQNNLLLVGISTVGVRAVTGLIGALLGIAGAVLGFGVGYGLITLLGTGTLGLVVGIGLGTLIFLTFTMVASVVSAYTATAYHTCLYLWARNVEVAQTAGQPIQVAAPAPLAAVLGYS